MYRVEAQVHADKKKTSRNKLPPITKDRSQKFNTNYCPHYFFHDEETLRDTKHYWVVNPENLKHVAYNILSLGDPTEYTIGDMYTAVLLESQGRKVKWLDWTGYRWSWGPEMQDAQPTQWTGNLDNLRACTFESPLDALLPSTANFNMM